MNAKTYTVSELNKKVKIILEKNTELNSIFVSGETSNVTYYKSGHLYFTLKDKRGAVKCVAFNYALKNIPKDIKEGDQVKVFASVTLYEVNGSYQLRVDHIEKENKLGALYQKYEELKIELEAKGYFDPSHKKMLPTLPLDVAIISSGTGAAVHDIINTAKKRFPNINLYVYPVRVQGEKSELEIAGAIKKVDKLKFIDAIIVGRGGGSIEDLWAFNTIEVAESIYKAKTPIISAVGHEIDFLISDFVADQRAATPTQAAEILVPEKSQLESLLKQQKQKIQQTLKRRLTYAKESLNARKKTYILKNFYNMVQEKNNLINEREKKINLFIKMILQEKKHKLELYKNKIDSLNPKKILDKGYTITTIDGKSLNNLENIKEGMQMQTIYKNGKIESITKKVIRSEK